MRKIKDVFVTFIAFIIYDFIRVLGLRIWYEDLIYVLITSYSDSNPEDLVPHGPC